MLGYIISDREKMNVKNHEIISFDIICNTDLNVFFVKDTKNEILTTDFSPYYFNLSIMKDDMKILKWFCESVFRRRLEYENEIIENAARSGKLKIIKWFKKINGKINYSYEVIHYASQFGRVKILKWFKSLKQKFKYNKCAICFDKINEFINNSFLQSLKFWHDNINVKKFVKWTIHYFLKKTNNYAIKHIKFKTKNNYIKGYNKN